MADPLALIKLRARRLHAEVGESAPSALTLIRATRVMDRADQDGATIRTHIKRRHCLSAIARTLGFGGWQHACDVIQGRTTRDYGTVLYPKKFFVYWNVWSASLEEARQIRLQHGGYLLPYRNQFFICDEHFIRALGPDPADESWRRMGRDWTTDHVGPRKKLYAAVIEAAFFREGLA